MIVRRKGTRSGLRLGSGSAADRRAGTAPKGGDPRRGRPHIEIQIHPGDIRKRVRYLFVRRSQVAGWAAAAAVYLLLMALALVVAPGVIHSLLGRKEYRALRAERDIQGQRLQAIIGRLGSLEGRSDELRLKLSKILLAYGLSIEDSIGQGGYPFEPPITAAGPEGTDPAALTDESRHPPAVPLPAVPDSVYGESIEAGVRRASLLQEQARVLETFLDEVAHFEGAHRTRVRTTPATAPLRGDDFLLTSTFGTRRDPFTKQMDFHAGIDLAAPRGKKILAPADGFVSFAGRYPANRSVGWWRYGNLVVLRHGTDFVTFFAHCDEIQVRRGQQIRQGDVLATVGNTGWSTGPHLHYEIRRRDAEGKLRPVDPRIYILDHRWKNEEQLLMRARPAPQLKDYQPLPSLVVR